MNLKELSKKYNKAKAYKDGLKTPFYKELKAKLESEIDLVSKLAILPGLDNEHDVLVEARAKKKILLYIEDQAKTADRLKEKLDETTLE
jgi:predicted nucleotidyltransferase